MQIAYFTERPYRWVEEEEVLRNRSFFAVLTPGSAREPVSDRGALATILAA